MSSAFKRVVCPEPILCFYINRTHQTQVARFVNAPNQLCDRIMRPNEHLLFEAHPGELLNVYCLNANGTTLLHSFSCNELSVSHELIEKMLRWLS